VSNCTKYYKAVSGDSCSAISDSFGTFSVDQFISWNPAVQNDCSKLFVGYYYCVAVPGTSTAKPTTTTTSASPTATGPSPTQSVIVSDCTRYYKAVSGDSCAAILDQFGTFSTSHFIGWNPAVQQDCSKLFVGYYYCVAVPGTPTQLTTSSATPTPTQSGPQPQQAGITKDCNKYYKVNNSDSCYNIEQGYGITAA
jgi:LysM repeat protein